MVEPGEGGVGLGGRPGSEASRGPQPTVQTSDDVDQVALPGLEVSRARGAAVTHRDRAFEPLLPTPLDLDPEGTVLGRDIRRLADHPQQHGSGPAIGSLRCLLNAPAGLGGTGQDECCQGNDDAGSTHRNASTDLSQSSSAAASFAKEAICVLVGETAPGFLAGAGAECRPNSAARGPCSTPTGRSGHAVLNGAVGRGLPPPYDGRRSSVQVSSPQASRSR